MLFNPSREEVRRFFIDAWTKHTARQFLTPLESIAIDWISEHPEYHDQLSGPEALDSEFSPESGQTNPFLHLSMHLSITEQHSIDQPPGIRAAIDGLAARLGSSHRAHHEAMECLGEMLWSAQRNRQEPDALAYLECVRRRATQS